MCISKSEEREQILYALLELEAEYLAIELLGGL
jgi:hypothetical protein